jgi:hypothetical protein
MGGLECRPEGTLPVLQKINHLAIRLGGETPDGVFEGGSVTINLDSEAARRLEAYIGYNSGTAAQATLLAQHWSEVRNFVALLQANSGTTITQETLSILQASSAIPGDTDAAAQLRAGVLLESAATLLRIFENAETCSSDILVDGALPRFAATSTEIRAERNFITTIPSLYVRMGGEDDDGGLPDGTLAASVTLTDVELREIDHLVGYRAPSEPVSPDDEEGGSELQRNWQGVRALIVALRNPAGLIDSGALDTIDDRAARERAAVQLQTVNGILRILRSEAWRAGRAYGTEAAEVAAPDAGLVVADAGPSAPDAGPFVISETPVVPEPVAPSVPSETDGGWSTWLGAGLCAAVVTGLSGFGLGWLLRGRNSGTSRPAPSGGSSTPRTPRTPPVPPAPPAPPPPPAGPAAANPNPAPNPAPRPAAPVPAPRPAVDADEMDDVLADLDNARSNQTPGASGSPSLPGGAAAVTADNVIIEGPSAAPVNGVDATVIRTQVVLHFRRFLSQTAREALSDGRPLPAGTELVNSRFEREVSEITDRIVAAYYERTRAGTLSDLWEAQRDRGYLVRRGVPERLLLEVANLYIEEHASVASSPFSGGEGAAIRIEAEREAGEARFLRDGMREVMRLSGR